MQIYSQDDAFTMVMRLSTSGVSQEGSNQQGSVEDEVDAQVLEIYKKITLTEERVNELRQQVPGEVATSIQSELVSFRPQTAPEMEIEPTQDLQQPAGTAARQGDAEMATNDESGAEEDEARIPDQDSWRQLNEVTQKVPALMAKLDQTLQRLTKIIDLTEQDQSRPSPRTVEKALMNRGLSENEVEDDIGATFTRRRLAHGLA